MPALMTESPAGMPPMPFWDRLMLGGKASDLYIDRRGGNYFVLGLLSLPIHDREEMLSWGVWSTLSRDNFQRYKRSYAGKRQASLGPMFGWLSTSLPGFPESYNLKCMVHPQDGGLRPSIELEPTDHPLAVAQREGIDVDRAIELVRPWLQGMPH